MRPLRVLDQFLRDTWLECCGHLSAFYIQGKEYSPGSRVNTGRILSQGMQFYHRYDFGSMTDLTLRVMSQGDASDGASGIRVLARNDPPEIPCFKCGASSRANLHRVRLGRRGILLRRMRRDSTRSNRLRAMRCSCLS